MLNSISSQCHSSVYAGGDGVANTVVAVSVDDVAWRSLYPSTAFVAWKNY